MTNKLFIIQLLYLTCTFMSISCKVGKATQVESLSQFPSSMKYTPPPQGYPPPPPPAFHQASLTIFCDPFKLMGGEKHCESEVFCPRTQHFGLARSQP